MKKLVIFGLSVLGAMSLLLFAGCEKSGADIAVATTGIAGPGGGTKEKPVGLVYVACADKDGVTVERLQLGGDRARVRRLATLKALDMVRRAAVKRYFE